MPLHRTRSASMRRRPGNAPVECGLLTLLRLIFPLPAPLCSLMNLFLRRQSRSPSLFLRTWNPELSSSQGSGRSTPTHPARLTIASDLRPVLSGSHHQHIGRKRRPLSDGLNTCRHRTRQPGLLSCIFVRATRLRPFASSIRLSVRPGPITRSNGVPAPLRPSVR